MSVFSPVLPVLKPEPISVPNPHKLISYDLAEELPGALRLGLHESSGPHVQFADVVVVNSLEVVEELDEE